MIAHKQKNEATFPLDTFYPPQEAIDRAEMFLSKINIIRQGLALSRATPQQLNDLEFVLGNVQVLAAVLPDGGTIGWTMEPLPDQTFTLCPKIRVPIDTSINPLLLSYLSPLNS
jgi:hypothetical protein